MRGCDCALLLQLRSHAWVWASCDYQLCETMYEELKAQAEVLKQALKEHPHSHGGHTG